MTWPSVAVRRVFHVVNGGTPRADEVNWGEEVRWATPVDIGRVHGSRIANTDRGLTTLGLESGSRTVPAGSLILSTRAPIGYVAETEVEMAFNQGCRGLVPKQDLDIRYHRYQLVAMADRLAAMGQGSTFVELSTEALASAAIVHPPLDDQRAIANYLDTETARIDALIAKKRRMIEMLEERYARLRWGLVAGPLASRDATGSDVEWHPTRLRFLVEGVVGGAWGDPPGEAEVDVVCIRVADFDRTTARVVDEPETIRSIDRNYVG